MNPGQTTMKPFVHYRAGVRQHRPRERSKLGCKNCLAKRVKCDEATPACGRCVKAGVICPGPRQPPEPRPSKVSTSSTAGSVASGEARSVSGETRSESGETSTLVVTPKKNRTIDDQEGSDKENGPSLSMQVDISMHKTRAEGETMNRFLKRFLPTMGIFMDSKFVLGQIAPATQGYQQVYNATLAIGTLYELPQTNIWVDMPPKVYEQYETAIKWYHRSLRQSMETPPDKDSPLSIALSLITIILYLAIELRQTNWKTQEGLVQSAYSIIYSVRSTIRTSKNFTILTCLSILLDLTCIGAINPACVPRQHFHAAVKLSFRLCKDTNATENYVVRCELYHIMYDVALILDRGSGSDFELECRMQSWLAHLQRYETSLPMDFVSRIPVLRCKYLYMQLSIMWESYLYGPHVNRAEFDEKLSRILAVHEMQEYNTRGDVARPAWYLDSAVIPTCVWVAWYYRSPSILARVKALFSRYEDQKNLVQTRLCRKMEEYIAILVATPPNQPTQVEIHMHGKKPRFLQKYMTFRHIGYINSRPRGSLASPHVPMNTPRLIELEPVRIN